jgi:hypothetical protein
VTNRLRKILIINPGCGSTPSAALIFFAKLQQSLTLLSPSDHTINQLYLYNYCATSTYSFNGRWLGDCLEMNA